MAPSNSAASQSITPGVTANAFSNFSQTSVPGSNNVPSLDRGKLLYADLYFNDTAMDGLKMPEANMLLCSTILKVKPFFQLRVLRVGGKKYRVWKC